MNHLAVISAVILLSCLFPAPLPAAEVWESKPFQDWSDKDLQRVTGRSPWARQTRATVANGSASGPARSAPPLEAGNASTIDPSAGRETGGGPGGGAGSSGAGAGNFGGLGSGQSELSQAPPVTQPTSLPVTIRWQTALPLRQAQMRAKYGREAATSPEAQKFLTQEPRLYLIAVLGLPGAVVSAGAGDQSKERIAKTATLTPKGKEPIRPLGVEFVPSGQGVDVLIGFARTAPIMLEDQEVEFASQIGAAGVKYKFKLKDMVLKGKLEL